MSDIDDPNHEIATAFDRFRADVDQSVEVEPALDALHTSRTRRPLPTAWSISAIVLSAAAVLAVAFVVVSGPDDAPSAAAPDPSPPATVGEEFVPPQDERCVDAEIFVYMEPLAPEVQIEAARVQLGEIAPDLEWEYLDQQTTFEEFQRLFAESPEFVESIEPHDLPTSFRGSAAGDLASLDLERIETIDGVLRAEAAEQYAAMAGEADVATCGE